jgi:PPOX class probable F420-dependent enzyme
MTRTPTQLLEPVRQYLAAPRCAVLSTLDEDGAPHPAVVHYLLDDDGLIVNGRADRRWLTNLRRDSRVSLVVHDADEPLHWVGIKGRAEMLHEDSAGVEDAMALARRYGEDPAAYRDQKRVSLRILPGRVFEYRP